MRRGRSGSNCPIWITKVCHRPTAIGQKPKRFCFSTYLRCGSLRRSPPRTKRYKPAGSLETLQEGTFSFLFITTLFFDIYPPHLRHPRSHHLTWNWNIRPIDQRPRGRLRHWTLRKEPSQKSLRKRTDTRNSHKMGIPSSRVPKKGVCQPSRPSAGSTASSRCGSSSPWPSASSWATLCRPPGRLSNGGSSWVFQCQSVYPTNTSITAQRCNSFLILTSLAAIGLLVMMYPILCKVRYESLHRLLAHRAMWTQMAFSIFVNWIIAPFLMVSFIELVSSKSLCAFLSVDVLTLGVQSLGLRGLSSLMRASCELALSLLASEGVSPWFVTTLYPHAREKEHKSR